MTKYLRKTTDSKGLASTAQIRKIEALINTTNTDKNVLLSHYGKSELEYLTISMAANCISILLKKYYKKV